MDKLIFLFGLAWICAGVVSIYFIFQYPDQFVFLTADACIGIGFGIKWVTEAFY